MAVLMTNKAGGTINMNVGREFANTVFIDYMKNIEEEILIDSNGNGEFMCKDGSVSVWVKKE